MRNVSKLNYATAKGDIMENTQCFILCGGKGERLRPLTDYCCKPMLKVQGKSILKWQFDHLLSLGFKKENIYFLAGYRAWDIQKEFDNVIIEDTPLGTAGAIKNIEHLVTSENFFVLYGDIISFEDHRETLKFHKHNAAIATIKHHLREVNSEIRVNRDNNIIDFVEHSKIKTNSDIYCFNKDIFDYIGNGFKDFPVNIFPILPRYHFYSLPIENYRIAIDSLQRLEQAEKDMLQYI